MDAYLQLVVSYRFYTEIIRLMIFLPDDFRVKTTGNHWLQIIIHAIKYM